jgi:acetyl-CoA acyltransferase
MNQAYLYDAVRTPFGKFGGALAGVRPDDLAAEVVKAEVARAPGLDPERIDEVIFGNANGAGEENRNVARMATLLAGLPTSIPGTTVNRLCGSSLDAAIIGSRQINAGEGDLVLIGGVESMSRAPWVLPKTEKPYPAGNMSLASTTLGWRLVNQKMPQEWTVSLGEATEQLRERFGISRERQDEFAAASHRLGRVRGLVGQRGCRRAAGNRAAGPDRRPRRLRPGTAVLRLRSGRGREPSRPPCGHQLVGCRRRRAQ